MVPSATDALLARSTSPAYAAQRKAALDNLGVVLAVADCVLSVRVHRHGERADHLPECVPLLASYALAKLPEARLQAAAALDAL